MAQTDDTQEESRRTALTVMVTRRIREAMTAREGSGIEEIWREDADQYDGVDDLTGPLKDRSQAPNQTTDQRNARSRVYLNITKPKVDSGVARVQEMLVPNDQKPWDIGPTPIPDFMEAADSGSEQPLTLADGTEAPAHLVAKTAMAKATEAAGKMADWIEDQFVEGSVYAELRKVIRDAGRLGTGVIKGPFPVVVDSRKWKTQGGVTALERQEKTRWTSKRKDIRDCFPDPACGDNIHNGSYFVERDYSTTRQLKKLARVEGFDRQAIAQALQEGPRARARDTARTNDRVGDTLQDSDVFELYYYYGEVDPATLIEMGVSQGEMTEEDLYLESVPAIVTILNNRAIRAVVNPLETGEFPFDFFPWDPIEDQPWGRGICRKMGVAQRMLVAAVRALMENGGLAAGPQIAIMAGAMKPVDKNYGITGRKLWTFTPTDTCNDINKAMAVFNIPSAQQELSAIIAFALQMADELTNLPMLLQGQQGAAPDLLGGMKMLEQNANAPLRVIAKQFDDYLIVRHLGRYYDCGMQNAPEECKGDMQIKALGSTALVQRELAREFLLQAHALAQRPGSRINPEKLDAEIFRSNGVSIESISYTDDEWKQLQEQKAQQPAPQDPRIEAAKIKAETATQQMQQDAAESQQRMQFEAMQNEAKQAVARYVAEIQFQIQAMEFADRKEISFADLKAMLAAKAIESRDKRELFAAERALKMDPANATNEGI
jgi:hypothetical protein